MLLSFLTELPGTSGPQLAFVRVYVGSEPVCVVTNQHLAQAHLDTAVKPAIIFRIAARNEKVCSPSSFLDLD